MWRQFPRQIASDLHLRGLHIKHWLRGTQGADGDPILSSYELLYILDSLDDESAFKTQAERGGRWPIWKQMLAEVANESYRFRSSFHAANSENGSAAFETADIEFVDPIVRAERAAAAEVKAESDAKSQNTFQIKLGYTR